MGNVGYGIGIYAILFLSIALLFFPAQQGYGFFTLSPELNDKELIELNKSKQIVLAEQTRDEIFVLSELQNPYLETPDNVPEYIVTNDEKSINSVDRNDESFQLFKDEQMLIAEEKFKELLGGKIILNSLNIEFIDKKSTHEFEMNDQIGHMDRGSDEFKDYKLLQISIAEDFRDNNWEKTMSHMKLSNPYLNDEPIILDFSFEENKISEQTLPYRQTEKYKNAITEQIAFAEKYRNQMLDYTIGGNPYTNEDIGENMFGDCHLDSSCSYIDENIGENTDESSVISNRNIIITGWSDPTYVTEELEINIIDRESAGFEVIQALEIEIAKNTLDEMGYLPNFEVSNEIISLTIQNEHRDIERADPGFEYLKDKEIDAAEKKLMEILGQKIIHNLDY